MEYRICNSKFGPKYIVTKNKKWHFARSIPIIEHVNYVIDKNKIIFFKKGKKQFRDYWISFIYLNFNDRPSHTDKKIILYKPRENKKAIRVLCGNDFGYYEINKSKDYILCYSPQEIEKAIIRYYKLYSLFG